MIKQIQPSELERCAEVIRESFATVAEEFGITKEIFPNSTAFTTAENLQDHWDSGYLMFGYYLNDDIIGYVSIVKKEDGIFGLHRLAVLPEYRHFGYGKELVEFCRDKAKELGGNKIAIGIIEENSRLKNWYERLGFVSTGTKKFDHQLFTAGFMELKI